MLIKLQIYVLCRDRCDFAKEAISSVIESAVDNTEVVISDNSVTDSVEGMCRKHFPTIRYIRRTPPLPAVAHFKAILDEATTEYLVMFHDDDIMLASYVTTLLPFIESRPEIAAVACNAERIDNNGNQSGQFFIANINAPVSIDNSEDFMRPYLLDSSKSTGVAPFPSYLYRRKLISSADLDYKHGGKHSDVTFLLKILHRAPIVWYHESLIHYRIHGLNDSASESICDRLSLIRYLVSKEGVDRKSSEVRLIRYTAWLSWWKRRRHTLNRYKPSGWREKNVFFFLLVTSIRLALTDGSFRKARWVNLIRLVSFKKRVDSNAKN